MNLAAQDTKTIVRETLEAAAKALEARSGNRMYRAAWRVAAKIIRSHKPD